MQQHLMQTIKRMYAALCSENNMDVDQQFGQTGPPPPLTRSGPECALGHGRGHEVDPQLRNRYLALKRARLPDDEDEDEDETEAEDLDLDQELDQALDETHGGASARHHEKKQALPAARKCKKSKKKKRRKGSKHLIQKTTFKAIVNEFVGPDMTVAANACRLLHNEAELYLSTIFENAQVLAQLNGRKTVSLADLHGVLALQCPNFTEKVAILRKNPSFMQALTCAEHDATKGSDVEEEDADDEEEEEEEAGQEQEEYENIAVN